MSLSLHHPMSRMVSPLWLQPLHLMGVSYILQQRRTSSRSSVSSSLSRSSRCPPSRSLSPSGFRWRAYLDIFKMVSMLALPRCTYQAGAPTCPVSHAGLAVWGAQRCAMPPPHPSDANESPKQARVYVHPLSNVMCTRSPYHQLLCPASCPLQLVRPPTPAVGHRCHVKAGMPSWLRRGTHQATTGPR